MTNLDDLYSRAEEGEPELVVSAEFILAVQNLCSAAELVVKSEGAYDLENLEEAVCEVKESEIP